jgi:hypothetical protein
MRELTRRGFSGRNWGIITPQFQDLRRVVLPVGEATMERAGRLRLISRVCYYAGLLTAVFAAISRITPLNLALARTTNISGRTILETSLVLFLICLASEARALGLASGG